MRSGRGSASRGSNPFPSYPTTRTDRRTGRGNERRQPEPLSCRSWLPLSHRWTPQHCPASPAEPRPGMALSCTNTQTVYTRVDLSTLSYQRAGHAAVHPRAPPASEARRYSSACRRLAPTSAHPFCPISGSLRNGTPGVSPPAITTLDNGSYRKFRWSGHAQLRHAQQSIWCPAVT